MLIKRRTHRFICGALPALLAFFCIAQNDIPDQAVFSQQCGQCHGLDRADHKAKTDTGWDKTVDWMRQKKNAAFSDKQAQAIKRYLKKNSADYAKQLLETRCTGCHSLQKTLDLRLPPEQWQMLVKRERARAAFWIGIDEAEQIGKYLAQTYPANPPPDKTRLKQEKLTEEKCLRCHVPETIFQAKHTKPQWRDINMRMREKSPAWISAGQAKTIAEFLSRPEKTH